MEKYKRKFKIVLEKKIIKYWRPFQNRSIVILLCTILVLLLIILFIEGTWNLFRSIRSYVRVSILSLKGALGMWHQRRVLYRLGLLWLLCWVCYLGCFCWSVIGEWPGGSCRRRSVLRWINWLISILLCMNMIGIHRHRRCLIDRVALHDIYLLNLSP